MDFEEFNMTKEEIVHLINEVLEKGNLTDDQASNLILARNKIYSLACVI
jgi:polyhydroxyalkanoate synthesis regulator phasin